MAAEENESRASTMDLNLYLGLPRSSRRLRSLDLGSDLSLSSLPLPASSDSSESLAPEATSVALEAPDSHPFYSGSHPFIAESDAPSAGPLLPSIENYIHPCFHADESYGPACAQLIEEPSILYSSSNAQVLQTDHVGFEPAERNREFHESLDDIFGFHIDDDVLFPGNVSEIPFSPTFQPSSPAFQAVESFGSFPSFLSQNGYEFYSRDDGSSSQHDLLYSPEFRIRNLIESHGWERRSLRHSPLYGTQRTNADQNSSSAPDQLMVELMSSQQSLDANGMQKASAEALATESEKEADKKNNCGNNFDCNICFDIAKEPVVTSCGHLFCWPCLYQWLHVHSDHNECPVCKGKVAEANITPIYGRGNLRSDIEINGEENGASGLSIPSRPRGNRLESWRQHIYPFSQRIGEGFVNPWGHFRNYQSRSRFSLHGDSVVQQLLSGGPSSFFTRSVNRRLQREQGIFETHPSTLEIRFPRDGGSLPVDGSGMEFIQNEIDSLAAMNSEIGRALGRFTENVNRYRPSSSFDASTTGGFASMPIVGERLAADQASASSTVAVITGESSIRDVSIEPNSAASSRRCRRLGGSSASCSSDDGRNLPACKNRRLNK